MLPVWGRSFFCEGCDFLSEDSKEILTHAEESRHRLTSPPDEEGMFVSILVEREGQEQS